LEGPSVSGPPAIDTNPGFRLPQAVYKSQLRIYRYGVFACLLALALMAFAAARSLNRRGVSAITQVLTAGLAMGIPLWSSAIGLGHPDELLVTGVTILA